MLINYKNHDGLLRDALKLLDEGWKVATGLVPHIKRVFINLLEGPLWKRPFIFLHDTTNLPVEACRLSPYFCGHAIVIYFWYSIFIG